MWGDFCPLGPMSENALSTVNSQMVAGRFSGFQRLSVRQRKKWLEILLSFEAKNSYEVFDETQQAVFRVEEVDAGFFSLLRRLIMGPTRPFRSQVVDLHQGQPIMMLRRYFRFFFPKMDVYAGDGQLIGSIEGQFNLIRRIYELRDSSGQLIGTLFGPFFKPWTFEIRQNDQQLGVIQKRWSGLGKELFTDADNFGVDLAQIPDPTLKALAFAATVLVDVVHFERAKG